MNPWIIAFRLRTLPLGIASVSMATILAYSEGRHSWLIAGMTLLTTVLLQILSNVANDYGDSENGADNDLREGPSRQTQTAAISRNLMKRAIIILGILTLISGVILLIISGLPIVRVLLFFTLGLICIVAAIKYTAGKNPYGYAGLGDLSVLTFFGWVGVLGAYYLQTNNFSNISYILPATTLGLFMVGVLNINNIRDIVSDQAAGKRSIPVRIGRPKAVFYHWILLLGGLGLTILFVVLNFKSSIQYIFLAVLPLLLINGKSVATKTEAMKLDPYLKQLVLTTLLFVVTFGIGHIISHI
jgi:1,4-dihydroxy-2-naphthoate octaprenyltransferase